MYMVKSTNIIARLKTKRQHPLGESNPQPCAPLFWKATLQASFFRRFQSPGAVAEW